MIQSSRAHARGLACLAAAALSVPLAASPALASESVDPPSSTVADSTLSPLKDTWGDDTTREGKKSTLLTGRWDADHDLGSMWSVTKKTGAQDVWGKSLPGSKDVRLTGQGVGVALIDTGIAPVEGLLTVGKVVNGADLSFDSQTENTRYLDSYGHGTHMAGIIAGRDSAVPAGKEREDKHFVGMAPDATLVNVKVGAGDGAADVSQVVAAVDWVVAHKADHNIRVLNLSYGTDTAQSPTIDPLAHAVENAWRAGIVVVVAAGNDGETGATRLTMPAVDPYVIAVGSSDHNGRKEAKESTVGGWTNKGTATRRPDLLAPGKSVVSLQVPGSFAATGHPEGKVFGDATGRLFRGTGTSQSAAVVSGAAALIVQRNPELTPDQVKGLLTASADHLGRPNVTEGAGMLDVKGAVELLEKGQLGAYAQTWPQSLGTGSLEASRGDSHVQDPDSGELLTGEQDIFGEVWDAESWASASALKRSWSAGAWRGATWTGSTWSGSAWSGVSWTKRSWSGVDWSKRSWSSMAFLKRSWSGNDWSKRSWSTDSFLKRSWSSGDWDSPRTS